jgi:phospholipase/carboxylesterase
VGHQEHLVKRVDHPVTRRSFLSATLGAGVALACSPSESTTEPTSDDPTRLQIRARQPSKSVSVGTTIITSGQRRAILHVPPTYRPGEALPLVIAFHGGGGDASNWVEYPKRTDAARMIFLAPESQGSTWDVLIRGFGVDVAFVNTAIAETFDRCSIDASRVALMGFSDGATYAIALGLANGDVVRSVIVHSPGNYIDVQRRGTPGFFFSHGTDDPVFPPADTSGFIIPILRRFGSPVEYVEFAGGHEVPASIEDQAIAWLKSRFA